jgi:hypothetical protein
MGASSIHPSHRKGVAEIGGLSIDALGLEQGLQLRGPVFSKFQHETRPDRAVEPCPI